MKKIFRYFDTKIKILLLLSIPLGIAVGSIEIILATSLNDLLIFTNLIDGEQRLQFMNPLFLIIITGFLRFILVYASQINTNYLFELVNQNCKKLVIKSNYINGKELGLIKSQNILNVISGKIAELLNSISEAFIQTFIFFIIYIHLLNQSLSLTIYSTVIFLVISIPLVFIKKKISLYSSDYQNAIGKVLNKIFRDIRNLNFLKIVGSLNDERDKILSINSKSLNPYLKYLCTLTFINQIPNFLGILLISLIIVNNNNENFLNKELLVPFLYLMLRSIISFSHTINSFGKIIFTYPFLEKLEELTTTSKSFQITKLEKRSATLKIINNFSLKTHQLQYGYENSLNSPISLELKQGEFCLFSGSSGVGKTTLILTLIGIQKKISGKILWDGFDIADINQDEFKNNISYCSTDPFLIEGTIKQNLMYGLNKEIPEKKLISVLQLTSCDFLKDGDKLNLNYHLDDEGSGLSSGQKQRLAIARALLSEPKVLILDEATVNIDEKTEYQILSNVRQNNKECLIFAISHRHSLKKFADKVINL